MIERAAPLQKIDVDIHGGIGQIGSEYDPKNAMLECKFACCGGLEFVLDIVVVGPGGRAVPPARERDDGPAIAVEDGGEGSAKREGGVALEFLADSAYHY